MPTYVYRFVKTGETIEVEQAFTDDTLTSYEHPETGRKMAVKKVFQPVGVTFRGSGFFKNDNRGSAKKETDSSSSDSSSSKGEGASSKESTSTSSSKADAAPSSSTSSGSSSSSKGSSSSSD